jgi:hypothetical protein
MIKRKTLICIAIGMSMVIVVYICCTLLIGVGPIQLVTKDLNRRRLRNEIASAKEKWQQHSARDYEIEISFVGWPQLWFVCNSPDDPVTIRVHDGNVVEAKEVNFDACRDVYQQLTIEALFDRVSEDIGSYNPLEKTLTVEFDPQWGYVARYRVVYTQSLLGSSYGESQYQLQIHSFRPLQ